MQLPLEPFASFASLIEAAIRDDREDERIHHGLSVADTGGAAASEHERGRSREESLQGLVGVGMFLATVALITPIGAGNWVLTIQSIGMLFVLVPLCALATPMAFWKFDDRF